MKFSYRWVPSKPKGARYFVRYGAHTNYTTGFRTKAEVSRWIEELDHVAWRVGFLFQMKGDDCGVQIVTRRGEAVYP